MGATYGAITTIGTDTTTPLGGNHTIAAGDNIVYVHVTAYNSDGGGSSWLTGASCTYGGAAMTLIKELRCTGNYVQTFVYRLASATLSSQAVSFAWTGGNPVATLTHVISCSNVNITGTPERTIFFDSDSANPSDSSVTITDATAGDIILSFGQWAPNTSGTLTPPSGATERANTAAGAGAQRAHTYSESISAAGDQVNTYSVNADTRTNQVAFAVKGIVGGGFMCFMKE